MKHEIVSDLIREAKNGSFDVIVHGCNCFNTMGAGIAPQIARNFPHAQVIDNDTICGDRNKLGTISFYYDSDHSVYVVNAYTQYGTSSTAIAVDYDALAQCFKQIKTFFRPKHIAYPSIGAGLAGGDWNVISGIIDDIFGDDVEHTHVIWEHEV